MKLLPTDLKINWDLSVLKSGATYVYIFPSFTWLGKIVDNETKQIGPWTICRELFSSRMREDILNKSKYMNTDRTCFMLKSIHSKYANSKKPDSMLKNNNVAVKAAMRVLNIIEKEAGWDLTTITKAKRIYVDPEKSDKASIINIHVVDGPKEWIKLPALLSLYLLIIRTCWFKEFSKIKCLEDIPDACKKLAAIKHPNNLQVKIQNQLMFVNRSYLYWMLLISNQEHLCGGRKLSTIYRNSHEYAGISTLIDQTNFHNDAITLKRWKKLVEEK